MTFDKDFGELAFRRGLEVSVGVVLFRITLTSPEHAVRVAVAAFAARAAGPPAAMTAAWWATRSAAIEGKRSY